MCRTDIGPRQTPEMKIMFVVELEKGNRKD